MQAKRRQHILKAVLPVWILCPILFFCAGAARADSTADQHLWHKANTFYTAKQYDSAGLYYGQLLKKYPDNATLQYNMGNACFRLNKTGLSVLHYEKAAHLDPGNREIMDNLLLARSRVQQPLPEVTPIFFVQWWQSLLRFFSPDVWAILSFVIFAAVLALVYFARVKKERFAHAGRWLSLCIVGLLICVCMAYFSYDATSNSGKAVVLQDAAGFRETPGNTGKILGNLPEGTVVEVYREEGSFVNIKLPNGREGWIAATALGRV